MPSEALLRKYDLMQFAEVVSAVTEGNLTRLDKALAANEDFFIKSGIYLILERLKSLMVKDITHSCLKKIQLDFIAVAACLHADWPDTGPDGSGDFYEDQFRLGNANSLRPAAPYDADRQRALLEGPFHRAPVQQLSLTCPTNDPAPCSILASCSAGITFEQPFSLQRWLQPGLRGSNSSDASMHSSLRAHSRTLLSRLYKYYATITWTVHGHLLKNLIDRSTLSTVKNDGPVKVTKATIALGSIFEDTCTNNALREPRGASCSEGRYLYKLSEPPCDYCEQCVFAQLNGVCTDHLIGDCALEFVRSLDGKTCDKLQTTAGNVDEVDMDELHCIIANLIYEGKIKGYISLQHQKLVVSKQSAFPRLSTLS
ncbi:hypothetical protein HPB49_022153 [Dermacentor silvarum]|uniref:Uncharacterized protein n=1 Tax=Dermacentor silvarum TaxID=543639 RepID=A0ACB8DGG0_DERSI|nr:hypothetical protein HPB49_022153 [Dermacentor silvarum]